MLLTFRVANFRSLRDQQELSMLVPSWVPTADRLTLPIPGRSNPAGTVAAIYGANASGKSNVIHALGAMAQAVVLSHQRWTPDGGAPNDPFLLDDEHAKEPTLFEVELVLKEERWQYGFTLDRVGVVNEWLYSFPRARKRVWFERDRSRGFYVGKSLLGPVAILQELTRPNSLFLSVGAANNHPDLGLIAQWFSSHLRSCTTMDEQPRIMITAQQLADDEVGPQIQRLLSLADLGIVRAELRSRPTDGEMRSKLLKVLEILAPGQIHEDDATLAGLQTEVALYHRTATNEVPLPLERESRGTQAWFGLAGPVTAALASGDTLLVDELDSSLHPQVAARLVRLFREPRTNPKGAQLIFTSHDASLLGNNLAENPIYRDELWLTEKDSAGATRLYPLTDFHPRKIENLERGYLQGRYGAVPLLEEDALASATD